MPSLRKHEGYLLIDSSASPGLTEEFIRATWPGRRVVAAPEGKVYESGTITCHHCQAIVILNPARTRPRNYCPGCDHYICDNCEAIRAQTLECAPFRKKLDEAQEAAARAEQRGDSPILLP